jgi:hypothetical protein
VCVRVCVCVCVYVCVSNVRLICFLLARLTRLLFVFLLSATRQHGKIYVMSTAGLHEAMGGAKR